MADKCYIDKVTLGDTSPKSPSLVSRLVNSHAIEPA